MTAVKRRLNFTGRKKIPHRSVSISLLPLQPNESLRATASFDIDHLNFPESGAIVLEAYQRSQGMRFELGSVVSPSIPDELELSEIDPGDSVLFRLKIVETEEKSGKILGAAHRLRPDSSDSPDGRRSLFPVDLLDLGPEVWRVRITDAGPRLQLHFRVPQLLMRLQQDPMIQGILLPQAFRQVLEVIAADSSEEEDDEIPWKQDWLRYCKETLNIEDDPADLEEEARPGWVDDVVRKFSRSCNFIPNIRKQFSEVSP